MSLLLHSNTTTAAPSAAQRKTAALAAGHGAPRADDGDDMELDILDVLGCDLDGHEDCVSGDGEGSSRSTAQSTKSAEAKSRASVGEAVLLFPNLVAPVFDFDRTAPVWEFGKPSTPGAAVAATDDGLRWFGMYSWDELEEWMDAGIGGMDRSVLVRSSDLNITAPLSFDEIFKSHEQVGDKPAPATATAGTSNPSLNSHEGVVCEDMFAAGALADPLASLSDALASLATPPAEGSAPQQGFNPNAPAWEPPQETSAPHSRPQSLSRADAAAERTADSLAPLASRPASLARSSLGRNSSRPASQARSSVGRHAEGARAYDEIEGQMAAAAAAAEWGFDQPASSAQGWGDAGCYGEVVGQPIQPPTAVDFNAYGQEAFEGIDVGGGFALREDPWATAELVKIMKTGEVHLPAPPAVLAAHLAALGSPDEVRFFLQSELGPHPAVGMFYEAYITRRLTQRQPDGRGGYRGNDSRGQRNKRRGGGKHRDAGASRRSKQAQR